VGKRFGRLSAGVDKVWEQDAKRLEATLREMLDAKRAARRESFSFQYSSNLTCTCH